MWSYELLRFHNIYAFFVMTYLFLLFDFLIVKPMVVTLLNSFFKENAMNLEKVFKK